LILIVVLETTIPPANDLQQRKRDFPIIRLIELDGFQAAVGVYCLPMSPTQDEVHGVKFIESDVTEEVSDDSDDDLVKQFSIHILYSSFVCSKRL